MPPLKKVALTINNVCNLKCPHCYLQYASSANNMISDQILEKVLTLAGLDVMIIVGMEPFYNAQSVSLLKKIAPHFSSMGTRMNVISNGLNLNLGDGELFQSLNVLDISMDGGEATYKTYRRGSYEKILRNIKRVKELNANLVVNSLNVLSKQTIGSLGEILDIKADFGKVYFSPYLRTLNQGQTHVDMLPLPEILKFLATSNRFLEDPRAVLSFGLAHVTDSAKSKEEVVEIDAWAREFIPSNFPQGKVTYPPEVLKQGMLRITYDGLMMDPYYALHTELYKTKSVNFLGSLSPQDFFDECYAGREKENWAKNSESRYLNNLFIH